MTLLLLLLLPLLAGVACLAIRSRPWLERVNLAAFSGTAICAGRLGYKVVNGGPVSAWDGFLYADALSALVVVLTAFVALVSSVYAVGYFRQDERAGKITSVQTRRYYRLTPFFVFAMLLVALANNLGVMWVAIEGTTLASVLLIAFYNEKSSLEAAWKYIIIGGGHPGRRNRQGPELVAAGYARGQVQPGGNAAGVRHGARGLRDQGGPGPHAHLEAGRVRGSAGPRERHSRSRRDQLRALRHHPFLRALG
jgi:hypothetical protein